MASIVYFKMLEENNEGVQYIFGFEAEEMSRTLTLNKTSRRSLPDDGNINYEFLKASRKINSLYDERGTWPLRGMSVS
ncbi:hypothetical protein ACFYYR_27590 [Streptomyces sp. NPDC001922]|uniref:hypothetical protein n=1 Tax=Streptomyces sp. NPDC001922 TaxID=3364624 RepID=UPI0036A81E67